MPWFLPCSEPILFDPSSGASTWILVIQSCLCCRFGSRTVEPSGGGRKKWKQPGLVCMTISLVASDLAWDWSHGWPSLLSPTPSMLCRGSWPTLRHPTPPICPPAWPPPWSPCPSSLASHLPLPPVPLLSLHQPAPLHHQQLQLPRHQLSVRAGYHQVIALGFFVAI